MNWHLDLLSVSLDSGTWQSLATSVLVRATIILLVSLLATWTLRRASASVRHLVWASAVVCVLMLPGLVFLLPALPIPILPAQNTSIQPELPRLVFEPAKPTEENDHDYTSPHPLINTQEFFAARNAQGSSNPTPPPRHAVLSLSKMNWLVLAWIGGGVVVLWPLALGHARLWKIKRQSTQWNLEVLTQAIGELQLPAWKARRVIVLRSQTENAPMTWGFGRSVILLPDEAEGWQPDRLRAVLLHELAHIHRGDYPAQILGRLACAVYWFHPLVWIAARRLRVEGEHACDDLVLQCDSRPSDYASHLLAIARGRRVASGLSTASVPMARVSQLEERLRAILDHSRNRRIVTRREVRSLGLFIAISLLSLSAVRPGPRIALGQTSPTQAIARETQDVPTMQVTGQVRDGKGQPIANAGVVILGRRKLPCHT